PRPLEQVVELRPNVVDGTPLGVGLKRRLWTTTFEGTYWMPPQVAGQHRSHRPQPLLVSGSKPPLWAALDRALGGKHLQQQVNLGVIRLGLIPVLRPSVVKP